MCNPTQSSAGVLVAASGARMDEGSQVKSSDDAVPEAVEAAATVDYDSVQNPYATGVRGTKNKNAPGSLQPASSESCEEPTGSSETLPVVDRRPLTNLLDLLGREHLASLLVAFRQQIGCGLLKELRDKGDRGTLERQLHTLFSTAGTLGFVALSTSCRRLERTLGSGTAIESEFEEVVSAIKRAGPELDSLIAEMAN
jgi:HPt (histidine-containing phosphotransfer) domain-containing protein